MMPPGLTLYVIRHGETEDNVSGRLTGRNNSPLTARGRAQARANGLLLKELAGDDVSGLDFAASSLHRTCVTMEILREAIGLDPMAYRADRRLMETDMGDWHGVIYDALPSLFPREWEARMTDRWNWRWPNGESQAEQYRRTADFLQTLTRDAAVVCHAGTARMIRASYLALPPEQSILYAQPNAGIMRLSGGSETYFGV